ncbi:delta endotoxin C-terminal domain-containing protein [Bacillus cereus]|uniref:delta endotoxin C-terminal domain-containing protein n=1 Tax=Bacillus cereus TaxID=1396 RepID=UPI0015970B56|nr:delta endotoxin C-terminal domain-containing protein [Bacillus cereus]
MDRITQIPAVKGYGLGGNATVIRGPGSTGGDLVQLPNPGFVKIQLPVASKSQSYRVRIRYASSGNGTLRVVKWNHGYYSHAYYNVSRTYSSALTYNSFKYLESYAITMYPTDNDLEIWLENSGGGPIIIDKIEFIPIKRSLEEFEANQAVEKARKAVNALFTNDAKNALQLNVTDYAVDQAANLVECVSEEFHAQEKMILLDQVKFAKRLSQARIY